MCRVVVETGGYRLAWIGFAEKDEAQTVRPVARAGEKAGGDCLAQLASERINKNVVARSALAEIVDFMAGDA